MVVALPRKDRPALAVAMMVGAVVCFASMDTLAKAMLTAGLAPLQVVFVRYAGHFVVSLAIYVPREGLGVFRSNAPRRQLLRSAFLMTSTLCAFTSLKYLPIVLFTTIVFAAPILVTLLAIPILGEKVGIRRIVAVCVGFLGVAIAVGPWGSDFHPAVFLALGALVCVSGYFIMTRLVAGVETNGTSQLWASGMATAVLAPFGLAAWVAPDDGLSVLAMVAIGAIGAVGHTAATVASRFADASILAPVLYMQLPFAGLAGIVVFATWPSASTLLGAVVIIASGLYIWWREKQKAGSE